MARGKKKKEKNKTTIKAVLYVGTHDSIDLGEDGPTHQSVEVMSLIRATPNINCIRPADGNETVGAYLAFGENRTGPTAVVLSRGANPHEVKGTDAQKVFFFFGHFFLLLENLLLLILILVYTQYSILYSQYVLETKKVLTLQTHTSIWIKIGEQITVVIRFQATFPRAVSVIFYF